MSSHSGSTRPPGGVSALRQQLEKRCEQEKRQELDTLGQGSKTRTQRERELRKQAFGMPNPAQARTNTQFQNINHKRSVSPSPSSNTGSPLETGAHPKTPEENGNLTSLLVKDQELKAPSGIPTPDLSLSDVRSSHKKKRKSGLRSEGSNTKTETSMPDSSDVKSLHKKKTNVDTNALLIPDSREMRARKSRKRQSEPQTTSSKSHYRSRDVTKESKLVEVEEVSEGPEDSEKAGSRHRSPEKQHSRSSSPQATPSKPKRSRSVNSASKSIPSSPRKLNSERSSRSSSGTPSSTPRSPRSVSNHRTRKHSHSSDQDSVTHEIVPSKSYDTEAPDKHRSRRHGHLETSKRSKSEKEVFENQAAIIERQKQQYEDLEAEMKGLELLVKDLVSENQKQATIRAPRRTPSRTPSRTPTRSPSSASPTNSPMRNRDLSHSVTKSPSRKAHWLNDEHTEKVIPTDTKHLRRRSADPSHPTLKFTQTQEEHDQDISDTQEQLQLLLKQLDRPLGEPHSHSATAFPPAQTSTPSQNFVQQHVAQYKQQQLQQMQGISSQTAQKLPLNAQQGLVKQRINQIQQQSQSRPQPQATPQQEPTPSEELEEVEELLQQLNQPVLSPEERERKLQQQKVTQYQQHHQLQQQQQQQQQQQTPAYLLQNPTQQLMEFNPPQHQHAQARLKQPQQQKHIQSRQQRPLEPPQPVTPVQSARSNETPQDKVAEAKSLLGSILLVVQQLKNNLRIFVAIPSTTQTMVTKMVTDLSYLKTISNELCIGVSLKAEIMNTLQAFSHAVTFFMNQVQALQKEGIDTYILAANSKLYTEALNKLLK